MGVTLVLECAVLRAVILVLVCAVVRAVTLQQYIYLGQQLCLYSNWSVITSDKLLGQDKPFDRNRHKSWYR